MSSGTKPKEWIFIWFRLCIWSNTCESAMSAVISSCFLLTCIFTESKSTLNQLIAARESNNVWFTSSNELIPSHLLVCMKCHVFWRFGSKEGKKKLDVRQAMFPKSYFYIYLMICLALANCLSRRDARRCHILHVLCIWSLEAFSVNKRAWNICSVGTVEGKNLFAALMWKTFLELSWGGSARTSANTCALLYVFLNYKSTRNPSDMWLCAGSIKWIKPIESE